VGLVLIFCPPPATSWPNDCATFAVCRKANAAWLNNNATKEQGFPAWFLGFLVVQRKLQDEMSLLTSAPTLWRPKIPPDGKYHLNGWF
jgi:hypothetical protein